VAVVVEALDSGLLDHAVHPFDPLPGRCLQVNTERGAVGLGLIGFGQAVLDPVDLADHGCVINLLRLKGTNVNQSGLRHRSGGHGRDRNSKKSVSHGELRICLSGLTLERIAGSPSEDWLRIPVARPAWTAKD